MSLLHSFEILQLLVPTAKAISIYTSLKVQFLRLCRPMSGKGSAFPSGFLPFFEALPAALNRSRRSLSLNSEGKCVRRRLCQEPPIGQHSRENKPF